MAIITGTSSNNTLIGTDQDDTISGLAGDDLLQGLGGLDIVAGGSGIDTVDYREKTVGIAVALSGATDATVAVGGVAEDTIRQIENVYGGSGDDVITGDGIDATLYSDTTTSVVVALTGAIAATVFVNGVAEDTIRNIENVTGGSGDDILTGDDQANTLRGEIGNDTLDGGTGNDTIDEGAGIDAIDMRAKTASVVVTLDGANTATVFVGGVAEDTVRDVENIVGGSAGDVLIGDDQANTLSGAGGGDWLRGGGGADIFDGGHNADYSDKTAAVAVTLNGGNDATVTVGENNGAFVPPIHRMISGPAALDQTRSIALAEASATYKPQSHRGIIDVHRSLYQRITRGATSQCS